MEKYSGAAIRRRLNRMRRETGGDERDLTILSRMAHEFGVSEDLYNGRMSNNEIVEITFNNQTNPSPLETEMEREIEQYLY